MHSAMLGDGLFSHIKRGDLENLQLDGHLDWFPFDTPGSLTYCTCSCIKTKHDSFRFGRYQNVINQGGHPTALVSMVTTYALWDLSISGKDSSTVLTQILHRADQIARKEWHQYDVAFTPKLSTQLNEAKRHSSLLQLVEGYQFDPRRRIWAVVQFSWTQIEWAYFRGGYPFIFHVLWFTRHMLNVLQSMVQLQRVQLYSIKSRPFVYALWGIH